MHHWMVRLFHNYRHLLAHFLWYLDTLALLMMMLLLVRVRAILVPDLMAFLCFPLVANNPRLLHWYIIAMLGWFIGAHLLLDHFAIELIICL